MRDYRKFCRPRTTKHPEVGDVEIKLNCGNVVYVKAKDYLNIKNYFKVLLVVGLSNNSSGNIKVLDKVLNKEIYVSPETYSENSDLLELVEIVGEKKDPFGQYEYVDLGLSSGTLWCTTNVGADSETAIGNYYKFGESTIYDGSDYNTSAYSEVYDPDVELPLEYDTANVILGGDWHIPTKALWDELINNTTHTYISDYNSTGVSVIKFEKTNDSSTFIIIPTTGSYTDGVYKHPEIAYYWTKTTNRFGSVYYAILTENSYFFTDWSTAFGHGHTVRAVCDSVDSQGLAQEGDIICHNTALNRDVIFSYEDWLELDDSWDLVGLYGITTYEEEDAANGDYIIMSNGHTLIIKPEDYSKISNHWEQIDIIDNTLYGLEIYADAECTIRPTIGNSYTDLYVKIGKNYGYGDGVDFGQSLFEMAYVATPTDGLESDSYLINVYEDFLSESFSSDSGGFVVGLILHLTSPISDEVTSEPVVSFDPL